MKETNVLKDAVIKAGTTIQKIVKKGYAKTEKNNYSPVTTADLEANTVLKESLLGFFPSYGWLSEETVDDLARLKKKRVWIVDPLDGTKEFINGIPEYVVSVALVENGITILAAVFNPITQDLFFAEKNKGAFLNGNRIFCNDTLKSKVEVLASRSEIKRGDWQRFENCFDVKLMGSIAYKLALIAAGKSDATFSLEPRSEWDIAAGVLLVQEAGGIIHDLYKKPFIFNQKNVRVSGIFACSKSAYPAVMKNVEPELSVMCL